MILAKKNNMEVEIKYKKKELELINFNQDKENQFIKINYLKKLKSTEKKINYV